MPSAVTVHVVMSPGSAATAVGVADGGGDSTGVGEGIAVAVGVSTVGSGGVHAASDITAREIATSAAVFAPAGRYLAVGLLLSAPHVRRAGSAYRPGARF